MGSSPLEAFEHRLGNLLAVGGLGGRLGFMTSKAPSTLRLIDFMEICICVKGGRRNIPHCTAFWMLAKLEIKKKKVNGLFLCLSQRKEYKYSVKDFIISVYFDFLV